MWSSVTVLKSGLSRRERKVMEALYIATGININKRAGDVVLAELTVSVYSLY